MDILSKKFIIKSPHTPAGDQPAAIAALTKGLKGGARHPRLDPRRHV